MGINLELIDEMRRRTNCSYQEAKELLEKNNGDLLEAIVEFEKKYGSKFIGTQNKTSQGVNEPGLGEKVSSLIKKGFKTRFIIEKGKETMLNISVNVLILLMLIAIPVFWLIPVALIVVYLLGYRIRIRKEQGEDIDISKEMDKVRNKVKTAAEKETEKAEAKCNCEQKSDDNGCNEITIE